MYNSRLIEAQITRALGASGAVVISGPKACGKTSTGKQLSKSSVQLDVDFRLRALANENPQVVLDGNTPRQIDEWQLVPEIWNAVRSRVDEKGEAGHYLLTGSSTPPDDNIRHSGAGRFIWVNMMPMSLSESGEGTNRVSLEKLFEGGKIDAFTPHHNTEDHVVDAICRGGWPSNLTKSNEDAMYANKGYLDSVIRADIVTVDGVRRDPNKVGALLYSLARNDSSYASDRTLLRDTATFGAEIDTKTFRSYTDALKRIWILHDQLEWGEHLRTGKTLTKRPKRHLVDPSLAVAALGITPDEIVKDRNTFGILFESLTWRDVNVYAQNFGAQVMAYHDYDDNEIDIIVKKDVKWAALEVKLSSKPDNIDIYSNSLRIMTEKMNYAPEFCAVITATGPSYTRQDGVHIINLFDLTA
jgi:predicted AAA+ superfamily ATPase